MFEDSLMESNHRIRSRSRHWSIFSFVVNVGALLSLVVWPLLHPEALPRQTMAALLVAPAPPPPPPVTPAPPAQIRSEVLSSNQLAAPSKIPKAIKLVNDPPASQMANGVIGMEGILHGTPEAIGSILGNSGRASVALAPLPPTKRLTISSGVMEGQLIKKTVPSYPAIAKAARIQGMVVLQATISKSGSIENLRVISGPPMLLASAMDAVRSWRYKPYLLNGAPVEVETTINIVFNLGG